MTELTVIVLLLATWGLTSIVIRLIDRRCKHEWETVQEHPVYGDDRGIPIAYLYVLRCKKCGDIKEHQVKYRGGGYNLP